VSGDTVTCSGSNPAGFVVDVGIDAVTVVVEETATVSSLGDGIRVRDASAVSNRGQIDVNGIGSAGIRGGNGTAETPALFDNTATGIITLNSPGAFGIRVGNFTHTTNDGEIHILGDGGTGIEAGNISEITNQNQIIVNGTGSVGIQGGNGDDPGAANAKFKNALGGTLTINGPDAHGVRVGILTRTDNDGEIDILGDRSTGLEAGNRSGIFNAGTLNVSGVEATGVSGGSFVLFDGSGEINVAGDQATGVVLGQNSLARHTGSLTLTGAGATGLSVGQNASIENQLDAVITLEASATGAVGLRGADSSDQIVNGGSITSTAPGSTGISVGDNSNLGINVGSMDFNADTSVGLQGGAGAEIVNELGAVLSLVGDATTGLQVGAGGSGINAGSLTLTGVGARGLVGADGSLGSPTEFANEASATLTVIGTVGADGAVGIDYGLFAEGENFGRIDVQGPDSIGIRAGADSIVRNSGEIQSSGVGAIGIEIGAHSISGQSGFINVAGTAEDNAGRLIGGDPDAGALIVMTADPAAPAGQTNRIENQLNASILADPAGVAIQGSSGDDVVVNAGLIQGRILLGAGNDRYLAEPGGQLAATGGFALDGGGDGTDDIVELTAGSGALGDFDAGRIQNFKEIRVSSGRWQLTGQTASATPLVVDRAGTLFLDRPTTVNGDYSHAPLPLIPQLPQPNDPEPTLHTVLNIQTLGAPILGATGSADLANGVLEVEVGGGFRGEAEFVLVRADSDSDGNGTLANVFDRTILPSDPNLVLGEPVYIGNEVRISVDVSGYSDNQWATSQAITGLSGAGIDPGLQELVDEIENLEFRDYLSAMDQLGPEAYDAHTQAIFELGHRFVQLMLERPRFCVANPGQTRADPRTDLPCREHAFDPWITSYGQFSRRDGSPGHISSEDNAGGLVLGFDRHLNDQFVISGTLGTAYDSIRVDQVGPGSFTTLDLGVYTGYRRGPLRLQAVASYGHSWQERFRNIAIGDFSGQTMGRYGVDRLGVRAEVEYGIEAGAFRVAPLISLDYTTLFQSAITETGGGAAALTLPSRTDTARTLRVGIDLSTTLQKKEYWTAFLENADGVWRPTLSLRWRQPLGEESRTVTARFTAADPSDLFSVQGDDSGQGFELGAGVDWTPLVADRLTFSLRYDGFFWKNVTSNAITGRIRLSF